MKNIIYLLTYLLTLFFIGDYSSGTIAAAGNCCGGYMESSPNAKFLIRVGHLVPLVHGQLKEIIL